MQKKFIALAVAGLVSGAAFAQSNVTIYGVADSTFDIINVSGATTAGQNTGSFNRVSTNSSVLGFKGVEALGNGLSAVFQYESAVGFDAGGALGASRDSYVGLTGGFGTVVLGQLTGPTRALGASVDVNSGATGIGANSGLLGKLGNNLTLTTGTDNTVAANACGKSSTCTSAFDTRWKNAIAYVSPSFSGLTATVAYVANENKSTDINSGTAAQLNTSGYDLGVNYANGPIAAGLTYNKVKLGTVLDTDANIWRLAGSYNFGVAKVLGLYEQTRGNNLAVNGDNAKQNVWGLGLTYNVTTAGKALVQFYKANDMSGSAFANNNQTGAKLWEIGYEHSLSKRTMVKASYANLNNDDRARYDYGVNAAGSTSGAAVGNGTTMSGFSVGVRHSF